MLRRGQDRFRRLLPSGSGGNGSLVGIAVGIIILIWAATGIYRVLPDEQGIVLRFGAYSTTTQPGLRYHLPYPDRNRLHAEGHPIEPDRGRVHHGGRGEFGGTGRRPPRPSRRGFDADGR
jgi:hypothetical protein